MTADGEMQHDRQEAEKRGFRKIVTIIDFERAGVDEGDHPFD